MATELNIYTTYMMLETIWEDWSSGRDGFQKDKKTRNKHQMKQKGKLIMGSISQDGSA